MNRSVVAPRAAFDIGAKITEENPRGKLLYKLLAVFLLLSIVPLLLAGYQLIRVGDAYIQKQIIGVKMGIAQKVASNVTSYMEDKKNTLTIVHKSSDFLAMNARRQTEILGNVMNAYPMFMRMTVIDLKGREMATVNRLGVTPRHARNEQMKALRAIGSLGDYIGPVSRSPEGYPQLTIGVPIERIPGRPIGVLLGTVNLIDLSSLIKDLVIDKRGYVYIVDMAHRQLVAHPDVQTLLSTELPSEVRAASLAPEENTAGAIEFSDQSRHRFLATYATVPGLNWRVFVQQPVEEAYQASAQMRREISIVLIVVILMTLGVGVAVSQVIVKRVQTLQQAMGQVGEGNFDVPQVPTSNDEFGSLTDKFLWMAASLKDKTLRLVSAQKELQKWNSELEKRVQERTRDLKEAQEQLIASEKLAALGQMASVVGHELRNPLAVMNNSVYFLKTKLLESSSRQSVSRDPAVSKDMGPGLQPAGATDGGLDPKIDKHLKIIEGEIVKSNTIIRDVLDFARNRALNAAPRRIDDLVEKAIERILFPPDVTLSKTLQLKDLEAMVDEDEIRQVLVNLMENACQAMTSGGTLIVGTKAYSNRRPGGSKPGPMDPPLTAAGDDDMGVAQAEWVEILIADTGCGIPQEHLNKIFAPFFTTKSRGTGLGLAVVKKIIERHQGQIEVKSKVGEGTEFHIRLPIKGIEVSNVRV